MKRSANHIAVRAAARLAMALATTLWLCAQPNMAGEKPRPRRAKPPEWTADVLDLFYEDAREHLVGERPAAGAAGEAATEPGSAQKSTSPVSPSREFAWSKLVSGESIESEVKRLVAGLREPLANPTKFKAGGYKDCRAAFSVLAIMFAVIAEHDGDVRWKSESAGLRDALARAAMNCKTATDQTFAEAAQRRAELEDIIRGERLGIGDAAELEKWSDLAERPLLMQRMEALTKELAPMLRNAKEFEQQAPEVRQKTELLSVLADVMVREEYDYWDDEGFRELAGELQTATAELTRAAAEANYEKARAAAGRTGQACSQCHEGYRG